MVSVHPKNLGDAPLDNAHLMGASYTVPIFNKPASRMPDCKGQTFRGAVADGDLREADLRQANLDNADLRGSNLHGAHLDGASLVSVRADATTIWPEGFDSGRRETTPTGDGS